MEAAQIANQVQLSGTVQFGGLGFGTNLQICRHAALVPESKSPLSKNSQRECPNTSEQNVTDHAARQALWKHVLPSQTGTRPSGVS